MSRVLLYPKTCSRTLTTNVKNAQSFIPIYPTSLWYSQALAFVAATAPSSYNRISEDLNILILLTAFSTPQTLTEGPFNYSSIYFPHTFSSFFFLLFLPLALERAVGFGLSNNVPPFCPICHQLSPSSHSQHLKISFHFFSPSFPGSSSSSRPFHFLSEDLFGHPILLHSLQVTNPIIFCCFIRFTIFSPLLNSSSSRFVLLFHSPSSYLGPYILLNIFL